MIRYLNNLQADGISIKVAVKKNRLKKKGINYGRYKLYDKKWLHDMNITTILDIGANVGEFTLIYAELFPNAVLHAFEPLPDCYEILSTRVEGINRIHTYNCGLGDEYGEQMIHRSSWAPASSFRSMEAAHKSNYPHSAGSEDVTVKIDRLDNIISVSDCIGNVMIKMDVQGFEDEVIKGGIQAFSQAKVVVVECSFVQLYQNEPKFHGIYSLLVKNGFEYRGSLKQSINVADSSYLQADAIFIRSNDVD